MIRLVTKTSCLHFLFTWQAVRGLAGTARPAMEESRQLSSMLGSIMLVRGEKVISDRHSCSLWLSTSQQVEGYATLTNHKLFFRSEEGCNLSVHYGLVQSIVRGTEPNTLIIACKDVRELCFQFPPAQLAAFLKNMRDAVGQDFISFAMHYSISPPTEDGWSVYDPSREYSRMGLKSDFFRISWVNSSFKFPSYPKCLAVPASISDEDLERAAEFRRLKRLPAVVWRHQSNGSVLMRSSMPLSGLLGASCRCTPEICRFNSCCKCFLVCRACDLRAKAFSMQLERYPAREAPVATTRDFLMLRDASQSIARTNDRASLFLCF